MWSVNEQKSKATSEDRRQALTPTVRRLLKSMTSACYPRSEPFLHPSIFIPRLSFYPDSQTDQVGFGWLPLPFTRNQFCRRNAMLAVCALRPWLQLRSAAAACIHTVYKKQTRWGRCRAIYFKAVNSSGVFITAQKLACSMSVRG